jgi:hypothetical protein
MTESTLKIISLVLSWPVAAVVIVLFLRKPIMKVVERFISGQSGKAKIGPIEVELGQLADDGKKAIQQLNDINHIVARSRLVELEITMMTLSHAFSPSVRIVVAPFVKLSYSLRGVWRSVCLVTPMSDVRPLWPGCYRPTTRALKTWLARKVFPRPLYINGAKKRALKGAACPMPVIKA